MTIYSVSDAYKTAIRARTRTDRVTGTLTLTNGTVLNLDAADLMSGSLTLDNQCVTGEELAFGCAYLGQAALNLRTDLSRYAFYGAKLRAVCYPVSAPYCRKRKRQRHPSPGQPPTATVLLNPYFHSLTHYK